MATSDFQLTQEYLQSILRYDPETGVFTWAVNRSPRAAGRLAGRVDERGYWRITINNHRYRAHRLVWLYVHGVWPTHQLDHINEDKADNRLANLREATNQQNRQNLTKPFRNNPYLGVSYYKNTNKWVAQIRYNNKLKRIGYFTTPEEARDAYIAEKRKHHPFGML